MIAIPLPAQDDGHVVRDVPRLNLAPTITPGVAVIHGITSLILRYDLPQGDIAFLQNLGVLIDLSSRTLPGGDIVRWSQVLDATKSSYTEEPGGKTVVHNLTGIAPDGTHVHVTAREALR